MISRCALRAAPIPPNCTMTKGKVDALLGIVFGDEGKGKVVDYFTPRYDLVARFAGAMPTYHHLDGKKLCRSTPRPRSIP